MKIIKVTSCLKCPYSRWYFDERICDHREVTIKTPLESIPEDCRLEDDTEEQK